MKQAIVLTLMKVPHLTYKVQENWRDQLSSLVMRCLIAIFLLFYKNGQGQNPALLDSLLNELHTGIFTHDTVKARLYLKLVANYYPINKDSSAYYNRLAYELSKKIGMNEVAVKAFNNMGVFHFEKGEYDLAEEIYHQVLDSARASGDESSEMYALWNLGNIRHSQGNYQAAMALHIESSELAENAGDQRSLAQLYLNISFSADQLGFKEEQKSYARKAIDLANTLDNKYVSGHAYAGLANSFFDANLDSAAFYFLLADSVQSGYDMPQLRWEIATGLGHVALKKHRYEQALMHFIRGAEAASSSKNHTQSFRSACDLALAYLELGRLDSAEIYFEKFRELTKDEGQVYFEGGCIESLIKFYEAKGDYQEANKYYQVLNEIGDSLFNKDIKIAVMDLERKYQTSQNEAKLLSQQIELQKKTKQRNSVFFLLALVSLAFTAIFFVLRQRNQKLLLVADNKRRIKEQKIIQLEKEKKILSMAAMIEGQEAERTRIAKDLHDGLGVLLSSVRRQVQNVQSEIKKLTGIDIIGDTDKLVASACEEVRRISHDMMPDALINFGIKEAIMDLADQIQTDHAMSIKLDIEDDLKMTDVQSINLYRVIQEFANNTLKHADATKLEISLQQDTKNILLSLRDDGKGFDLNEARQKGGLGISNIESRIDFLKGVIKIDTREGACYFIRIPNV